MSRRFPESNHIEFLPLPCEVLVEVGQSRLEERGYTLQGNAETAKTFESVMRYEADKHPPENAGGAINAVDAMINGEIHLVVNTVEGQKAIDDSKSLRRTALTRKIPYHTTLASAFAVAQAIKASQTGALTVASLQSYAA